MTLGCRLLRGVIVVSFPIALAGMGALATAPAKKASGDARAAVERSLDYIEREGFAWMDGRVPIQDGKGCVSCHHVSYGVWSLREAQRRGIEREGTEVDLLESRAYTYLDEAGCRAFSCAPLLFARESVTPGADVKTIAAKLADAQEDDGGWRAKGQFPTQHRRIEESDAAATMWAVLAEGSPGAQGVAPSECRDAALGRLAEDEPGESTEWYVARLLVDHHGGDANAVETSAWRLLERQNADGGWPWRADQGSDAMSTGQAVYALAVAGNTEAASASLRRAVAYLLDTQEENGTWITDSKLVSTEPGEGKDYVYTYWGTTWASIGLSRALDSP